MTSAFSVEAALDRHVAATEEAREPDGMWHPSGMFHECDRKVIYQVRGVTPSNPPDRRSRRTFRLGHMIHELVQEAVSQDPTIAKVWHEVKVLDEDLRYTGHADSLVLLESEDGTHELQEYKSIKSSVLWSKPPWGPPKQDHEQQARSYMRALRLHGGLARSADGSEVVIPPLGDSLQRGRITYLGKDDLTPREFTFKHDPRWDAGFVKRIEKLEGYRNADELPPRPLNAEYTPGAKPKWPCGWCDFRDLCWQEDDL